MESNSRLRFVLAATAGVALLLVVTVAAGVYSLEIFYVLSVLWLLATYELCFPPNIVTNFRRRIQWLLILGLFGLFGLIGERIYQTLQAGAV